ncbi:MAG: class I SAM-dependent methyltransferase, partial [Pseudomonadota bacterium]
RKGWGSINAEEAEFIQSLIAAHRPLSFVEIGTASGLSGGLICRFMDEAGGKRFVTIDHDNTFFGDPSQPNGFALPAIYGGDRVHVNQRTHQLSIDLALGEESFDMAFVDANHRHPWPLIDTLCLYPRMTGSKLVVHHDLRLFRQKGWNTGIGPKYLFDQFPGQYRKASPANKRNTFYVDLNLRKKAMRRVAVDGFLLPWTARAPMAPEFRTRFESFLTDTYGPEVTTAFRDGYDLYVEEGAPQGTKAGPIKAPKIKPLRVGKLTARVLKRLF